MMQPYKNHASGPVILNQGGWLDTKVPSYQYRDFGCGDKAILRPFYLDNEISYTGKNTSLYWTRAQ